LESISSTKFISRVKRKKQYKKHISILLLLVILQFTIIEGIIVYNGKSDAEVETNYLIILGAGINGETISLTLYERLLVGQEYLNRHPDATVIVSGGQGRGESITEAEAMRRFLISNGIDESRILLEDRSTSTMENFKFSKQIIEERSGKQAGEVTFATSSFHVFRSKMLAGRNGFKAHAISSKTPKQVVFQMYFREYFALFKSLIVDR
jgi:uncharacterized SAM-binding protein YcdF (DUF218 family)